MYRPRRFGHWLGPILSVLGACSSEIVESPKPSPARARQSPPSSSLIREEDAQHDLGHHIAVRGRTLEHRYKLTNPFAHPVSILGLDNLRPCCGAIDLVPRTLAPAESAEAVLTLSLGDGSEPTIVHEAVIHTDPQAPKPIVLRTVAHVQPKFRVEELEGSPNLQVLKSEPRQRILKITAYGTSAEPPTDLEKATFKASIPVSWLGPGTAETTDSEWKVLTRDASASLDARSLPEGIQATSVHVLLGQEPLVEHVIRWEVVSPITAAPRRIVLSTEKPEFHFALSAVDRATFRVDRIEAPPGMIASLVHKGPPLYRIRVTWDGTTPLGKGNAMLRVQTDHPSQPEFQIPITLLD